MESDQLATGIAQDGANRLQVLQHLVQEIEKNEKRFLAEIGPSAAPTVAKWTDKASAPSICISMPSRGDPNLDLLRSCLQLCIPPPGDSTPDELIDPLLNLLRALVEALSLDVATSQLEKDYAAPLVLACSINSTYGHWTTKSSRKRARELLEAVLNFFNCTSAKDLLCGKNPTEKSGCFGNVLHAIKPNLTQETYKDFSWAIGALDWCLARVTHPSVGPHLDFLIPPTLILLDDMNAANKQIGIKWVNRIVCEVDPSELRRFNRVDVILDALKHQIYSKNPDVVGELLRAPLARVIDVAEPISERRRNQLKWGKLDETVSVILSEASMETHIEMRRVFIGHLDTYIKALGISVCKHMKRILSLIEDYLEFPDESDEELRLGALVVLEALVVQGWPRMNEHAPHITKTLIKMTYKCAQRDERGNRDLGLTLGSFESVTETKAQAGLLLAATKCLTLLLRRCHDKYQRNVEGLRDLAENHAGVRRVLKTALISNI